MIETTHYTAHVTDNDEPIYLRTELKDETQYPIQFMMYDDDNNLYFHGYTDTEDEAENLYDEYQHAYGVTRIDLKSGADKEYKPFI